MNLSHRNQSYCPSVNFQAELAFQFLPPLPKQRVGYDNEYARVGIVEHCLTDNYASLDCLPKPYFVSKEIALDWIFQNAASDLHLVREQVDIRGKQPIDAG